MEEDDATRSRSVAFRCRSGILSRVEQIAMSSFSLISTSSEAYLPNYPTRRNHHRPRTERQILNCFSNCHVIPIQSPLRDPVPAAAAEEGRGRCLSRHEYHRALKQKQNSTERSRCEMSMRGHWLHELCLGDQARSHTRLVVGSTYNLSPCIHASKPNCKHGAARSQRHSQFHAAP
ncbi:hypothetical protein MPTK1_4g15850 [Marchantia polymorpha subsp. ruderalis]|uniref:Uncharacterized protein n=2 Tax=Marchantia polymorpha TaxID=3197 RepID=A0AAF6BAB7_MARPO|nr:hypothetical protein MARPO_0054s0050 [Marchantia polymorpha]BBN08951.1 hypothetical protein Mp_4g15850 [Marchantia polymorpha subsp. ruderalis]|eukprot:PTQ37937.1 hypothetical protein MARPO_0054s0050 [Marchantia polymorpha]